MNSFTTFVILGALLAGPLIFAPLEHNLEPYCLGLGIIAVTMSGRWEWVRHALLDALPITLTVIVAGLLFGASRDLLDGAFAAMRRHLARAVLVALAIMVIA